MANLHDSNVEEYFSSIDDQLKDIGFNVKKRTESSREYLDMSNQQRIIIEFEPSSYTPNTYLWQMYARPTKKKSFEFNVEILMECWPDKTQSKRDQNTEDILDFILYNKEKIFNPSERLIELYRQYKSKNYDTY